MRVGKANGGDWLRLAEAAEMLGVSLNTVRRWSDHGRLRCYRSPGGHRRYRRADIEAALIEQGSVGTAPREADRRAPREAGFASLRPLLQALARVAAEGTGVASCALFWRTSDDAVQVVAAYGADVAGDDLAAPVPLESCPAEAEVLRNGLRLIITDMTSTKVLDAEAAAAYGRRGLRAVLALPIIVNGRPAGVMRLADTRAPRPFTGAEVAFADLTARQAAHLLSPHGQPRGGTVRDAPPFPEVGVTPLSATPAATPETVPPGASGGAGTSHPSGERDASPADKAADDQPDFPGGHLTTVVRILRQACDAVTGTVWAVSGGTARALTADPEWPSRDSWRLDECPPVASAVESGGTLVLRAGEGEVSPDVAARFLATRGLAGVVFTSVVVDGRVAALLELGARDRDTLRSCLEVAQAGAEILSAVARDATTISRLRRRISDLELVAEATSYGAAANDTREMLRGILRRLTEATHTPVGDIYSVEGATLRALVSYDGGRFDDEWEGVAIPLSRYPLSMRAVAGGEPVTTAALEGVPDQEARFSLEKWGYQSQLSMPLHSGGRVIGLLELSDYVPRDFSEEAGLARALSHAAARVLEQADLSEQAERRSRMVDELVELAELGGRTDDLDTLVRSMAERLQRAVDAGSCDIFRADAEGLRCVASFDRSGHAEQSFGELLDAARWPSVTAALNAGKVLVVTGPDDPQLSEAERRAYREYGYASEVCIPVICDERLCGALDVYDTHERDFAEHMGLLLGASRILAAAFRHAALVEQSRRSSRVVHDLVELGALAARSPDLRVVLGVLARRLCASIQTTDCDVFAVRGGQLHFLVSVDAAGTDLDPDAGPLDIDRYPATAMAVRSGEIVMVEDLSDPRLTDEERADMSESGYESELCVPFTTGDRVVGLFDVFDTRPRDFEGYRDLMMGLAQIAAAAMERDALALDLRRHKYRPPADPADDAS